MTSYTGKKKGGFPLFRIFLALCVLGIVTLTVLFILMGTAAGNKPPEDADAVLIVLGCQVNGNTPSVTLQGRIDTAYTYLAEHPDTLCIASGGQGKGENITEAQAIRDSLTEKGIEAERIILEPASASTYENIQYSAELIEERGLPRTVVIASDNFHQLRAALFARKEGLEPYALGCRSPFPYVLWLWPREAAGVVRAATLGW